MKCNFIGCDEEATVTGHIYGHVRGGGEKDNFLPVQACDEHAKRKSFFPDKTEEEEKPRS